MNIDVLVQTLSEIQPLSPEFINVLQKEVIPMVRPKNYLLLESPKVAEFVYFLNDGFAMSYSYPDGEREIEAFWKSGQIISSINSFIEQAPSNETIRLMSKCDLLCVSYASMKAIFEQFPEAGEIYRKLLNRHYQQSRSRFIDLKRLDTVQRFTKLLTVYPNIEQVVPQDAIASYLGMTPQTLSRLKKEKTDYLSSVKSKSEH